MIKKAEKRLYPREVWVISPAYVVKQVTVVKNSNAWLSSDCGDVTDDGKRYAVDAMYKTKQDAIDNGRRLIEVRREYLANQYSLLDARAIKLDRAEAK